MTPNERVLVTGGSGGIGSAIAWACAARGAWPIVGYCSHEERAAGVVAQCGRGETPHSKEVVAQCGRGETYRIDLGGKIDHAPAVEAVVHCAAAFAPERSLLAAPDDLVANLLAVNLLGPLQLTRALMATSNTLKRIVFILSSASFCRGTGSYALSKAAELALCRLLANELGPSGVRVDAIVPGWTTTATAEQAAQADGRGLADVAREHPDGVLLEPREIGELCATLLFDHSDAPPGNLIVWDLRDGPDPVWHALNNMNVGVEFVSGHSEIAN